MTNTIERKPKIAGILGTILFWTAFMLLSTIFSLFARKPIYKTVQIRLDSPQTKTQEARAAAAPKSAEKAVEPAKSSPSVPAQQTQTAQNQPQKTQSAPQPAQTTTKPAQNVNKPAQSESAAPKKTENTKPAPKKVAPEPVLQKSMEELMAEQLAAKTKKQLSQAEMDALFENSESNTSFTTAKTRAAVKEIDALSGNAGNATSTTSTAASASSAKSNSQAASSGTSASLSSIAAQSKVDGGGISSESTNTASRQTNGNADIHFASGVGRRLLTSAKIDLSEDAQKAVTGQAEMQISFTVRADGTVTNVIIPSYLPQNVRQEIAVQISRWQFSAGAGNDTATFNYKIKD